LLAVTITFRGITWRGSEPSVHGWVARAIYDAGRQWTSWLPMVTYRGLAMTGDGHDLRAGSTAKPTSSERHIRSWGSLRLGEATRAMDINSARD